MKFLRIFPVSLLLISIALLSACSLSKDVMKMDDPEDHAAYVEKWAPTEDAFVAVQRIAKPAIDAKNWEDAAAVFEKYKSRFPGMESRFETIIAILRAESYDVELTNLGDNINSPANDIKPSVTVDGSRLYFASDRKGGMGKLDIYVAEKVDGEWQPAVNLGDRINTPDHETINGLSFDGTKILIYGGFPGHLGNGDNYYFEKTERGWSGIKHFPAMVNSRYYDSDAFMTADGFAVLFTSDREGVVGERVPKNTPYHGSFAGNTDIFVSVRRGTYWQPPINLGPTINTPYAERSPFLHPDGRTLYFSSDAHPGLGKLDVFKSVRANTSTWTEWSEPVNLGKDVNGSDDDWGYRITPDGIFAFFSTSNQKDGRGENDIYMITLPRGVRPEAEVATIKGTITDEDGNPVNADILVQRLSDGEVIARLQPDPSTGKFEGTIPKGENVAVFAEREGYYPDARNLDLSINGDGSGTFADGTFRNDSGGDGSGDDGSGKNGSGGDGSGKNGSGGDGSGKNGSGDDGSGKNGSGDDGSGKNGSGDDGSGKNGSGDDGSGKNGSGDDGSGKNGSGDDGDGGGDQALTVNFNLKSVSSMKTRRDQWGNLLAQRVNNIFFDFAKWDLRPESNFELGRLVRFLETNPELRIVIAAHTDDIGSDQYNFDLSRKRALSVVNFIVSSGIDAKRLESIGYGESRPEVPNDSEENRARNRRVEFRIAE